VLINKDRNTRVNKKSKQLRRIRHTQPPQDIHGHMVKKLKKGETASCVKLHQKHVPGTTKQASNLNKDKGNKSSIHVVCTNDHSITSKSKRRIGKIICFKCKKMGHFIASWTLRMKRDASHITRRTT
jgi:hypothetical protein